MYRVQRLIYTTFDFVSQKKIVITGKESATRDTKAVSQLHSVMLTQVLLLIPSVELPQPNRQITATMAAGFISMPSHKTASSTQAAP
jgi:hypothetical protein